MMNKYLLYLATIGVGVAFAIGCQSEKKSQRDDETNDAPISEQTAAKKSAQTEAQKQAMMFVGAFGPNKINVVVQNLSNDGNVSGYSVVSGNQRPFTGTYTKNGDIYQVVAKEPGDNQYDGTFEFALNTQTNIAEGKWTPFKKSTPARSFKLTQRKFEYNPIAGSYPETSTQLLTEADVNNLLKQELRIMRNEIFARHGYSFKMKDMRSYFDEQEWYIPVSTDVRNDLSEVEKKNVDLIKRYEKYATDYYDEYGR